LKSVALTEALSFLPLVFHANLLMLNDTGRNIVTVLGLLLASNCLLAFYLWWPRRQVIRKIKRFDLSGNALRKSLRLHSLFGFWLLIPMAFLGFSGAGINSPSLFGLSEAEFDAHASPQWLEMNERVDCAEPAIDAATERALASVPGAELSIISRPRSSAPYWFAHLRKPDDIDKLSGDHFVYLSPRCLDVLKVYEVDADTFWNTSLLKSLHTGRLFGLPGETVIVMSGTALITLFISGVVFWLLRRRARAN
ncbi:MAG: PepSY-associated TM helix domain-containing protein, partial [Pseudomonadota bacterium]